MNNNNFQSFIRSLLKIGKLKEKYINEITDPPGIEQYKIAFTHESIDPKQNYEFFETLGDQTLNKSIVWYFSRRFPELNNPQGSDVISYR